MTEPMDPRPTILNPNSLQPELSLNPIRQTGSSIGAQIDSSLQSSLPNGPSVEDNNIHSNNVGTLSENLLDAAPEASQTRASKRIQDAKVRTDATIQQSVTGGHDSHIPKSSFTQNIELHQPICIFMNLHHVTL